ncbi:MAG: hypothetical protein ABIW19_06765 [Vicinamibacterales bacterium]
MDFDDLEQLIDRELKKLPASSAPHTLLPGVMLAVEHRMRAHAGARPWRSWGLGWQVAAVALTLAFVVGASLILQSLGPHVLPAGDVLLPWLDSAIARSAVVGRVVTVCWRAIVQPFAVAALVPLLMMCMATLVCGAAIGRLAYGGPSRV